MIRWEPQPMTAPLLKMATWKLLSHREITALRLPIWVKALLSASMEPIAILALTNDITAWCLRLMPVTDACANYIWILHLIEKYLSQISSEANDAFKWKIFIAFSISDLPTIETAISVVPIWLRFVPRDQQHQICKRSWSTLAQILRHRNRHPDGSWRFLKYMRVFAHQHFSFVFFVLHRHRCHHFHVQVWIKIQIFESVFYCLYFQHELKLIWKICSSYKWVAQSRPKSQINHSIWYENRRRNRSKTQLKSLTSSFMTYSWALSK